MHLIRTVLEPYRHPVRMLSESRVEYVSYEGRVAGHRDRHAEKLREELTLVRVDRHSSQLEELDVEGILAFASASCRAPPIFGSRPSLDQRQRFQQLFFPDGIAFDGNRFIGPGATAPAFSYLAGNQNRK
jgi:hypothetical protein